jgi:hypothetical protein
VRCCEATSQLRHLHSVKEMLNVCHESALLLCAPSKCLCRTKEGTYILSGDGFLLGEVSHYKVTVAYSGTSPSLLIPFRVFKIDPSHTKHSQMIKWSRVFRCSVVTSFQNSFKRSRSLHMTHRPHCVPHYEMLLSGKYFPFNFGTQIPGFGRAYSLVMVNFAVERNEVRGASFTAWQGTKTKSSMYIQTNNLSATFKTVRPKSSLALSIGSYQTSCHVHPKVLLLPTNAA